MGVFRSGFYWVVDANGDDAFTVPPDWTYAFGTYGDAPLTGHWLPGANHDSVGVYEGNGVFVLDLYDNGIGASYTLGNGSVTCSAGDLPVVGDWNGSGTTKIGIYRPSTGQWFLDSDGTGSHIVVYNFGGITGDVPVVGDWSATGTSKIGIFRYGYYWLLDYNGNGSFDGTGPGQDKAFPFGGVPGDVPVVGDWNGDGRGKVGVFRTSCFSCGTPNFFWVLDTNGDELFDGADQAFAFGGVMGDVPVVANWRLAGGAPTLLSHQVTILINGSFDDDPAWTNTGSPEFQAITATMGSAPVFWPWTPDIQVLPIGSLVCSPPIGVALGCNYVPLFDIYGYSPLDGYVDIYTGGYNLAVFLHRLVVDPGYQLNLISHSHGGNVVKVAAWLAGIGISPALPRIQRIINLGTPQNWDLPPMSPSVSVSVCQVSSTADYTQVVGSGVLQVFAVGEAATDAASWSYQAGRAASVGDWTDFANDTFNASWDTANGIWWTFTTRLETEEGYALIPPNYWGLPANAYSDPPLYNPVATNVQNVVLNDGSSHSDLHEPPVWSQISTTGSGCVGN